MRPIYVNKKSSFVIITPEIQKTSNSIWLCWKPQV